MKSVTVKIIVFFISIFLIASVGYQIYLLIYSPIKTEIAINYSATKTINFKGIYIRNEQIVENYTQGVISYKHKDGSKVAKNSVIAVVHNSENDILIENQIAKLENQIAVLNDSQQAVGVDISQLENLLNQIDEKHSLLLTAIIYNELDEAAGLKDELLSLVNKTQIVSDKTHGFTERIMQYQAEIDRLKLQLSGVSTPVYSNITGYFSSNVDGYEKELNYGSIADLTEEIINDIIKTPNKATSSSQIGKLAEDYAWKLVGLVEVDSLIGILPSAEVKLQIGDNSKTIYAVVEESVKLGDKAKVVFNCNDLASELTGRTMNVKIILEDYTGIRISRESVRFDENEVQGVYVLIGSQVIFKKINILYWGEDYVIIENTKDSGYISLYDKVIKQGMDLYDGKILQ